MCSVVNNIMQRDIILRTSASEKSDNQSIKLVDSSGKRPVNSKISMYERNNADTRRNMSLPLINHNDNNSKFVEILKGK